MAVNLKGVFNCCQAVIPLMLQREDGGKIVNISSVAGKMGGLSGAQYAASKAGVIGLTMALSTEFAKAQDMGQRHHTRPDRHRDAQSLPAEVQQNSPTPPMWADWAIPQRSPIAWCFCCRTILWPVKP
jgi:hypothetical protein